MKLEMLKRAQAAKVEAEVKKEEAKALEAKTLEKERKAAIKAFTNAVDYGFSILDGATVQFSVTDLTDDSVELIASILGDEKAVEIMEKHDFIFEVKVSLKSGNVVEKIFTFATKDARTGAELVLNEVASIIASDFSSLVLDTISLSGKRVLKVTEDMHIGDFVKREAVGLEFSAEDIESLAPFKVATIEKVNYEGTEKEITYKYNVITDPLGNSLKVFLIGTTEGMVAKLKKGSFGLINYKNLTAIEYKLLKRVVDFLASEGIEIALEGKKAKDLNIWDEVDTSTITNAGKLEKLADYAELKVPEVEEEGAAELDEAELEELFANNGSEHFEW